jgi:hypothetical protein
MGHRIAVLQSGRRQAGLILFGLLLIATTFFISMPSNNQTASKSGEHSIDKGTEQASKDAPTVAEPKISPKIDSHKPEVHEEPAVSQEKEAPKPTSFKSSIECEGINVSIFIGNPAYEQSRITIRIPDAQYVYSQTMAPSFPTDTIELSPGTHTISFHLDMKFMSNERDLIGDCSTKLVADKARRYKWKLELTPSEGINACYITSRPIDE